eukprot:1159584-Pelagomonas_calceolata.AAC.11
MSKEGKRGYSRTCSCTCACVSVRGCMCVAKRFRYLQLCYGAALKPRNKKSSWMTSYTIEKGRTRPRSHEPHLREAGGSATHARQVNNPLKPAQITRNDIPLHTSMTAQPCKGESLQGVTTNNCSTDHHLCAPVTNARGPLQIKPTLSGAEALPFRPPPPAIQPLPFNHHLRTTLGTLGPTHQQLHAQQHCHLSNQLQAQITLGT